jgi:glycosyltransferase involved in cell wall biosynthesis
VSGTSLISVIVTTYNREDALDAVIRALGAQSDQNFEIIIADDGSGPDTTSLIESWKPRLAMPLKHVRHEHRGFRGGEIRNRGIRASAGALCIFLDGDCVARSDFIAAHRRLYEPGWFVTGNRILLSRELTWLWRAAISITSTASIMPLSVGVWRIPISSFVFYAPACVVRMDDLLLGCCICGIHGMTARNLPPIANG